MIQLHKSIEKNYKYIQSWNIFSRTLFLQSLFWEKLPIFLIVEDQKQLQDYLKISQFLGIKLYECNNYADIVDLFYNKLGNYVTLQNIVSLSWKNLAQFEYSFVFSLSLWEKISSTQIVEKLVWFGYEFCEYESEGCFQMIWDTLHFMTKRGYKVRISFWWDEVEKIETGLWNTFTQRDKYFFWKNLELNLFQDINQENSYLFFDLLQTFSGISVLDSIDFYSYYEKILDTGVDYICFNNLWNENNSLDLWITDLYLENIEALKEVLWRKEKTKYIFTKNKKTIVSFLELNSITQVEVYETYLNNLKSFSSHAEIVLCDDNISRIFIKKRVHRRMSKNMDLLMQIQPGDYVVHIDHGIWIFKEIIEKELGWIKKEYITLEYKENDKLFVPITEVSRVSKYVWIDDPKLTALSTKQWEKKIAKAQEDVEATARELLDIFAKRKIKKWFAFASLPNQEQKFAHSFEYVYTDDQIQVISEIYKDMESSQAMDRLVSGDVWFWKTEIAFASIFKAIINGKQAALISPLIVLAYEHYEKAKQRFVKFPFQIEILTRFETATSIKNTLKKLKEGKIDLLIGTHRLLSQDVLFRDLWLLVIDEEHKFWVKDKEKIKNFKWNIDILSLSATPIPRSLNMALNGIKSVSILTTPPLGRQSISTIVSPFDDALILQAGKREFERGWQLFFIHNRVSTIDGMRVYLEKIFPGKKIQVTHGQLPGDQLEKRILEFKRKQYDILLSTTVIENGIDFSNVNTIFINDASRFWISQIHQLRGRVWRSDRKWYCYLLFKKDSIKEDAAKRLKTMVDYSHLWSGFELAVKDLEIRWWWDILGIRQSGQSVEIGVNLYLEMLEDKIEQLKAEQFWDEERKKSFQKINTTVDLHIWAYIDDSFFASSLDKLNFYREIETLQNKEDLDNIITDFCEINSNIPEETQNFFDLLSLKFFASEYKIECIKKVWIHYQIDFSPNITQEDLRDFLQKDLEVKFFVVSIDKIRSEVKNFGSTKKFLQYMLKFFSSSWAKVQGKKKIKLKKL